MIIGAVVGAITATFTMMERHPTDVEVDAAVQAERVAPLFEPPFDPSRARAPKDCGDRQWIAERGPDQQWSTACVDFRQKESR